MATRRTPEELFQIVSHCIDLEIEGGDILAYLWSKDYISPRATWMNFQRQYLHRKPYEYTDGKPCEKKKGETDMAKFKCTDEMRGEAIRIALDGGDPKAYLADMGCQQPEAMWGSIRKRLAQISPEIYEKLPKRIPAGGVKKNELQEKAKAAKQPAEMELDVVEYPEGGFELQPVAKEEPKPGTVPLQYDGLTVRGLEGEYGRFFYDAKFDMLDWTTPDGEEVSFCPASWKELIEDVIPKVMGILGVSVHD